MLSSHAAEWHRHIGRSEQICVEGCDSTRQANIRTRYVSSATPNSDWVVKPSDHTYIHHTKSGEEPLDLRFRTARFAASRDDAPATRRNTKCMYKPVCFVNPGGVASIVSTSTVNSSSVANSSSPLPPVPRSRVKSSVASRVLLPSTVTVIMMIVRPCCNRRRA